jgi:WD40 repeat protein
LDPEAGPAARFAQELRELRAAAGGPTYRSMAQAAGFSSTTLSQAAGGRRLPSLDVALAYVTACGGDLQEWEKRWRAAQEELAVLPVDVDGEESPYSGLARFEPGDRELFFGRDELTARALDLVGRRRVCALVGASGSGKSSLLRAGVLPALGERGELRLSAVRILTPGPHPARDHAARLLPAPGEGDTLVVVDQFEEVFTLCADTAEQEAFLDALAAAADPESRLRVVLGVRADFFARCAQHPGLAAALSDATLLVGPMTPAELRQAVVKPAAAAGLIVERSLTARIVAETAQEPGGLPLMSHALLETWRRRRGRALTEEMYQATGGIHAAVATTAETVYQRLTAAEATAARDILLRLVTPGQGSPDTRRPAPLSEVETGSPQTRTVLEHLVRARLLTLDGETVDLAHEALLTAWPRYRRWNDQARERLRLHRQLTAAAELWEQHGRDPGFLHRGSRLSAAEDAFTGEGRAALTAPEAAFLDASTAARDRETRQAARTARRLRSLTVGLSILLALALTASVVAVLQSRRSDQARKRAVAAQQVSLSRQLAAESGELTGTDADLAMLLAAQAYRTSPTAEAVAALYRTAAIPLRLRLNASTDQITTLAFSPDGRTLAAGGGNGTVVQADTATGRTKTLMPARTRSIGKYGPLAVFVMSLAFQGRGRSLTAAFLDGKVRTWDMRAGTSRPGRLSPFFRVTRNPSDGRIEAYHLDAGPSGDHGGINVHTSPDGHFLTSYSDRAVDLWDAVTGRHLRSYSGDGHHPASATVSNDGRVVAAAASDGTVQIWDASTSGSHPRTITSLDHQSDVKVALSGDGRLLATGREDGTVDVWDVATAHKVTEIRGFRGPITALAFSADDHQLAAGTRDGTVNLWNLTTDAPSTVVTDAAHPGDPAFLSQEPWQVGFVADGRQLATNDYRDGSVQLWDARSGRHVSTFTPQTSLFGQIYVNGPYGLTLTTTTLITRLWDGGKGPANAEDAVLPSDGRWLISQEDSISSHPSTTFLLWDITSKHPQSRAIDTGCGGAFVLSPDSHTLAVQASQWKDGFCLVDIATGHRRKIAYAAMVDGSQPTLTAFSPDGHTLAFRGGDSVQLLDSASGRMRATLTGSTAEVTTAEFSPDGRTLAVGSNDGTVRLWDTASQQVRTTLTTGNASVESVDFSPDGRRLATRSYGGTVQIWDVDLPDPQTLIDRICHSVRRSLTPTERARYLSGPSTPTQAPCALASPQA